MGFERFCAQCGKITDALINGVCTECYLKKHNLFEVKQVAVERCVKCGKIRIKGDWESFSNELIATEVASRVKFAHGLDQPKVFVELTPGEGNDFSAEITVEGFLGSVLVKQSKTIEFSLQKVSCDSCMKLSSNYREAIIQIRPGSVEEAEGILETAKVFLKDEEAKNSLSTAVKILKGPTGYDMWVGANNGAAKVTRKLSKLYKMKVLVSKKLIGPGDGKRLKYRFTYLLKK